MQVVAYDLHFCIHPNDIKEIISVKFTHENMFKVEIQMYNFAELFIINFKRNYKSTFFESESKLALKLLKKFTSW